MTTPPESEWAAFEPTSVAAGALIPAAGRDLMVRSLLLPPGVLDATDDGWLSPDLPVLVRDGARVIPIAWWGVPGQGHDPQAEHADIIRFARHLLDTGMYAAGPWRAIDLTTDSADSIGSYAAALRASGATKADWFVYVQDYLGVVVVWAGDEGAGDRSVAVHVVPEAWVFERAVTGPVEGIDVSWTWADVVALASDRPSPPAR